jgi:hypothetical protein
VAELAISTAARNAACDAVVDLVDGGSGAGTLKIYTGSRPAGPGSSATGTLLATITCNDPAFGGASSGVATLNVSGLSATAAATGTAGWARFADSNAAGVMDMDVTATGGGGTLTLDSTSVSSGVTVTVTSGTVTMPAS